MACAMHLIEAGGARVGGIALRGRVRRISPGCTKGRAGPCPVVERGIDICHQTVRYWWTRLGPMFAVAPNALKGFRRVETLQNWLRFMPRSTTTFHRNAISSAGRFPGALHSVERSFHPTDTSRRRILPSGCPLRCGRQVSIFMFPAPVRSSSGSCKVAVLLYKCLS